MHHRSHPSRPRKSTCATNLKHTREEKACASSLLQRLAPSVNAWILATQPLDGAMNMSFIVKSYIWSGQTKQINITRCKTAIWNATTFDPANTARPVCSITPRQHNTSTGTIMAGNVTRLLAGLPARRNSHLFCYYAVSIRAGSSYHHDYAHSYGPRFRPRVRLCRRLM